MNTWKEDADAEFKSLNIEASHLEKLVHKVSFEGWPEDSLDAWIELTAMAASIRRCYCGCERIVKSILLERDGALPSSDDFCRQLIERAANVGPHGRPPLLDEHLSRKFHELRSFVIGESSDFMHEDPSIAIEQAAAMVKAVKALGERIDRAQYEIASVKKLTLDPADTQKRLDDGRGEADEIIEAMRQKGVTVRLFGSMNTGKAFPNSDIDLLVTDCGPLSPEQVLVEIHAMEKDIPLDVLLLECVPEGSLQRVMESLKLG